ncbi:MAG: hypothetical protein PHU82_02750 [Candidatus Pacebacteria bacterium]|jgi:hypothetical protein|nr:hypothetical protein [Candidatus Paceibacterota bacterium]
MEEIILKIAEYGTVGGVAIALTYLYLVYPKNGKDSYEKLAKELKLTNENHLNHIYEEMKKQSRAHEKQIEVLYEILGVLKGK